MPGESNLSNICLVLNPSRSSPVNLAIKLESQISVSCSFGFHTSLSNLSLIRVCWHTGLAVEVHGVHVSIISSLLLLLQHGRPVELTLGLLPVRLFLTRVRPAILRSSCSHFRIDVRSRALGQRWIIWMLQHLVEVRAWAVCERRWRLS